MKRLFLKNTLLIIITIFAVIIRISATNPGYLLTHQDESTIADSAYRLTFKLDAKPMGYYYGSLLSNLYAVSNLTIIVPQIISNYHWISLIKYFEGQNTFLSNCANSKEGIMMGCIYSINPTSWQTYIPRYQTAILSGLCSLAIFFLTLKLFKNIHVSLISSFLTAINYRHFLSSTLSLADAPTALFVILSVILSYQLTQNRSYKQYLLAGIGIGLALSTKYFYYVIPPFIIFHFVSTFKSDNFNIYNKIAKSFFSPKVIVAAVSALIVFLFLNPYFILDWKNASFQMAYNAKRYGLSADGIFTFEKLTKIYYFPIFYFWNYGLGKALTIFTGIGLLIGLKKYFLSSFSLLSSILPFLFFFLILTHSPHVRNYSSIIPLICIFTALGIYEASIFISKIFKNKLSLVIILVLVTIVASLGQIKNDFLLINDFSKVHNSKNLIDWTSKTFKANEKVLQYWKSPIPNNMPLNIDNIAPYTENYYSIQQIQEKKFDWAIVNSDSQEYIVSSEILENNAFLKRMVIHPDLLKTTYREKYSTLVSQEIYYYKVAEFNKSKTFLSLDPGYFVSKIPPKPANTSYKLVKKVVNSSFDITCRGVNNNLVTEFIPKTNTLYAIEAQVKTDNPSNNHFLRLDYINNDNISLTHVSSLLKNMNTHFLYMLGKTPDTLTKAKVSVQTDSCISESKVNIPILNIYEVTDIGSSDLYPNKPVLLPDNFIWLLPL